MFDVVRSKPDMSPRSCVVSCAASLPRRRRARSAARGIAPHTWPRELYADLAAMGLFGLTVPEEYGGQGRDIVAAVAVDEELSAPVPFSPAHSFTARSTAA